MPWMFWRGPHAAFIFNSLPSPLLSASSPAGVEVTSYHSFCPNKTLFLDVASSLLCLAPPLYYWQSDDDWNQCRRQGKEHCVKGRRRFPGLLKAFCLSNRGRCSPDWVCFFSSPPEKKWIIGMFLAAFMSRDLLHLRGTEAIAFWSVSRDERRQSSLSIPTLVLFLFYMSFPAGFHFSSVVETEAGYVFLKSAWLEKWACLLSAGKNTEFELCFPFRFKFPPRALHSWRL